MKTSLLIAASAFALASLSSPLWAQHMDMPGMTMPKPEEKAPVKKAMKKPVRKKTVAAKPATGKPAVEKPVGSARSQAPLQSVPMDHGTMTMPANPVQNGGPPMPIDHSKMRHEQAQPEQMGAMPMPGVQRGGHEMPMSAALGSYPMERESSGTAWQPDTSEPMNFMTMSGGWTLMAHGVVNLVADHQSGRRGDDKAFVSGMLMGMARRPFGNGTLQFKAMVSPDPLMGPTGYPLLLASGETANGRDRLIDRQHPHDFFMELSASVSQKVGRAGSIFLYAGLPGEPAFGPPAFMHREAILDSPEAPISHHWLDSTHISFGVVTGGLVLDRLKVEVSRFNAREPDQHRWDIETGPLDSTAVRLSWNPTGELAFQGSWGHFKDPEQLEPGVDQKRLSASLLYAREVAPGWKFAGTLAWGRKIAEHHKDDAYAAEASLKHRGWTLFGRAEVTHNRELAADVLQGPAHEVGKMSIGAVRDFPIADHLLLGGGGLFALNFVPNSLAPAYGSRNPTGLMGFVRLRLD